MSLVVPRLGTTNDGGGGTMSPVEAKIVAGGRHISWVGTGETMRAALTPMRVSTPVCPRAAVGQSAASRLLEGSSGGRYWWSHTAAFDHCW